MPKQTVWHDCYKNNLKDLITRESFAHPAKMSRSLCERIFDYGHERGYWQPGDLIVDPFGGIGTTGLIGAYRGYQVLSLELEPRFVALAQANIQKNRAKLERLNRPLPIHLQGDSRNLIDIISPLLAGTVGDRAGGEGVGIISSPPFLAQETGGGLAKPNARYLDGTRIGQNCGYQNQAGTEGNLASMREGSFELVMGCISSPPYADSEQNYQNGWKYIDTAKTKGAHYSMQHEAHYGETPGQIGALKSGDVSGAITSPPFADSTNHELINQSDRKTEALRRGLTNSEYVSPIDMGKHGGASYGSTAGQIGSESGETYWQAVAIIYTQLFQVLPSGAAAAIVVKDYVKNKQIVPLCHQTCQLLEALGFCIVERIHATLVKEHTTPTLFGGDHIQRKERKSFFRRLAEKKGSPRIDYEEVIWAIKP